MQEVNLGHQWIILGVPVIFLILGYIFLVFHTMNLKSSYILFQEYLDGYQVFYRRKVERELTKYTYTYDMVIRKDAAIVHKETFSFVLYEYNWLDGWSKLKVRAAEIIKLKPCWTLACVPDDDNIHRISERELFTSEKVGIKMSNFINLIPVVGIAYMVYEKSFNLTITSIILITILLKILTFKISKSFLIGTLSVLGFIKLSNILKLYVESKKEGK